MFHWFVHGNQLQEAMPNVDSLLMLACVHFLQGNQLQEAMFKVDSSIFVARLCVVFYKRKSTYNVGRG